MPAQVQTTGNREFRGCVVRHAIRATDEEARSGRVDRLQHQGSVVPGCTGGTSGADIRSGTSGAGQGAARRLRAIAAAAGAASPGCPFAVNGFSEGTGLRATSPTPEGVETASGSVVAERGSARLGLVVQPTTSDTAARRSECRTG